MRIPLPPAAEPVNPARPLPSLNEKLVTHAPATPPSAKAIESRMQTDLSDPVPLSGVPSLGDAHIYFIRIGMEGAGLSGFTLLAHKTRFPKEELEKMVAEATRIANARVQQRREQMARNQVPISDPATTNEQFFRTDLAYFDGVMCDKWDFRVLFAHAAEASVEPTIKGWKS